MTCDQVMNIFCARSTVNSVQSDSTSSRELPHLTRGEILEKYLDYCSAYEKKNTLSSVNRVSQTCLTRELIAPVFNLFSGEDGSDKYQRMLKKSARLMTSATAAIRAASGLLPVSTLTSHESKPLSGITVYPKAPTKSGHNNRRIA